ncbi:hypothetical protein [Nonlabens xiamenensis]|uniref:hypothetical protein n=1 Tax=Nonlabens xiamenensis TaxID=2341043 RepID=UPI000F608947|nr:hypothetical protein [Nonlabens xiamenensis]
MTAFASKGGAFHRRISTDYADLIANPKAIELFTAHVKTAKSSHPSQFNINNLYDFTRSNFESNTYDLLIERIKKPLQEKNARFRQAEGITIIDLNDTQLSELHLRYSNNLSPAAKDFFLTKNRFYVTIENIDNTTGNRVNTSDVIIQSYISGKSEDLVPFITELQSNVPNLVVITDPNELSRFKSFHQKAIDFVDKSRKNDTEIKMLFNINEVNWSTINSWDTTNSYIKISGESVLDICTSCQRYLESSVPAVTKSNLQFKYEIKTHPRASEINKIEDLIN